MAIKIFRMLDPRENRLPTQVPGLPRDLPVRKVPLARPEFFVQNNPAVKRNIAQFDPVNPGRVRAEARQRLQQMVDEVNRQLQNNIVFKGVAFEVDEAAGRTFAVVKNQETGEVIKRIPSEEMLRRAAVLKDASGLLQDVEV